MLVGSVGLHFLRSALPLPIFDRGNAVVSFRNGAIMEAVLNAAKKNGVKIVFDIGSSWQTPRYMTNTGTILNLKPSSLDDTDEVHRQLRNVTGGWIFVSRTGDPNGDATALHRELEASIGQDAYITLLPDPDPTLPENTMAFVLVRLKAEYATELYGFRLPMAQMPKPKLYRHSK